MNGLTLLRERLPLLLVFSPVIGFLLTLVTSRHERDLTRRLAVSNSLCTLLILGGIEWQFETNLARDAMLLQHAVHEISTSPGEAATIESVHQQLNRQRVERVRHHWFVVDGINLWPTAIFVLLTTLVIWQADASGGNQSRFFPTVLLFEAATIAALLSYDLCIFGVLLGTSSLVMSVLIALWGGSERRDNASRFLHIQLCGGSLVMLGFAMVIVAVPWMKTDDVTSLPAVSMHIASIVQDVQKWASRNELAFQYENEVFPWLLLVLSTGFMILSGLFPFHSRLIAILRDSPPAIVTLQITGLLPVCSVGWYRFVVPLAPDFLASFDGMLLIPAFGGAFWGALRAFAPGRPRERTAYLFLSLAGVSLFGCYSFTRIGMAGAWLMQQQLAVTFAAVLLGVSSPTIVVQPTFRSLTRSFPGRFSRRNLLIMFALPFVGLFASGFAIVSQLVNESLFLASAVFLIGLLIAINVIALLAGTSPADRCTPSESPVEPRFRAPFAIALLVTAVVNLFPELMLHQCEPEFARVFRRYERAPAADSAERSSTERQTVP
jgi:NADH:ubiquinone oxidoreductase subunit 4 (subunit M)